MQNKYRQMYRLLLKTSQYTAHVFRNVQIEDVHECHKSNKTNQNMLYTLCIMYNLKAKGQQWSDAEEPRSRDMLRFTCQISTDHSLWYRPCLFFLEWMSYSSVLRLSGVLTHCRFILACTHAIRAQIKCSVWISPETITLALVEIELNPYFLTLPFRSRMYTALADILIPNECWCRE